MLTAIAVLQNATRASNPQVTNDSREDALHTAAMSRPTSAASSATTQPTIGHRRQVSERSLTKTSAPSNVSLFLANLRILDLGQRHDWLNVSTQSFSAKDARQRIRCVEYSLFHLFAIYDPESTREKLAPFFPPLEPLQSLNLRAALYRCLNELKKNGILGREAVLRKTMLDDCQGEKLWEVLLLFSAAVVKKMALSGKRQKTRPVAEVIATAHTVGKREHASLLPLAVAHRSSLTAKLRDKEAKRLRYDRLHGALTEEAHELKDRQHQAQQAARTKELGTARLKAVEHHMSDGWLSSDDLRNALLHGDGAPNTNTLLQMSFDEIWKRNEQDRALETEGAKVGLLEDLDTRVKEQNSRLRKWRGFQESLLASKQEAEPVHNANKATSKSRLVFEKHHDLRVGSACSPSKAPHQNPATASKYDEILTTLREDLRKAAKSQRSSSQTSESRPPEPTAVPRKPSLPKDTVAGATAAPLSPEYFRPGVGRRVSSRSKTWQRPRTEAQREPRPLKCEAFSPLKSNRRASAQSMLSNSSISSPSSDSVPLSENTRSNSKTPVDSKRSSVSNVLTEAVDEATEPLDTPITEQAISSQLERKPSIDLGAMEQESTSPASHSSLSASNHDVFKIPLLPMPKAAHEPTTTSHPSLAERTRMSMANISDTAHAVLPEPESSDIPSIVHVATKGETMLDRRISLADRTRQSMSLHQPLPEQCKPKKHKSGHARTRSSIYPTNQFATPKKLRRSSVGVPEGGLANGDTAKRNVTPREKLFSEDAEYNSVFKSRPKIALSPVLSPFADKDVAEHLDGMLDGMGSSPLVGFGR